MNKYAVVIEFTFSPHVSVLVFNTREEAMDFIKKDVLEEYNNDLANGFESEYVIHEEDGRAILTAHFDDDDVTEWKLGTVFNPRGN